MSIPFRKIAYFLPEHKVSNLDLAQRFGVSEAEVFKKSGVNCRYRTKRDFIGSDLAVEAFEKLKDKYEIDLESIESIIFVTEGADYIAPMTAAILQDRIGLSKNVLAIDLPNGCSGFTHSLSVAKGLIKGGVVNNALLLFGDTPGLVIPEYDFYLQVLFSDAGSALFLTKKDIECIGDFSFGSDGKGAKSLYVDYSGFRTPVTKEIIDKVGVDNSTGVMKMNGLEVFTFSIQNVPLLVSDILAKNQLKMDEIDYFIFHQPSQIILDSLIKKMSIPKEKLISNLSEFGNTVASTIPISISLAIRENKIKKGDTVLIAGFGIGFSMSGTVIYF